MMALLEVVNRGLVRVTFPNEQAQRFFFFCASPARQGNGKNPRKNRPRFHRSSRLLGIGLINQAPAHNGGNHLGRPNLMRIDVKNVLRNDNQVGDFTNLDGTFRFFTPSCKRRAQRVGFDGLRNREPLFG